MTIEQIRDIIYETSRKGYQLITQLKEAAEDPEQSAEVREFAIKLLDSVGAVFGSEAEA